MAWLGSWAKRIKLTVDHTRVDAALSHFPVTVILSSTQGEEVFSELGSDANRFKIAFTKADETTQLYAEIEQFDYAGNKAIFHVSKSDWSIASDADTDFYLYYDSSQSDNTTYIGDIGSTPGQTVWNSDFKAVYHMVDATTSTIKDSTANGNDGTKKGTNEPVEAAGKVGQCQDFDGSDDSINIGNDSSLLPTAAVTLEAVTYATIDSNRHVIVANEDETTDPMNGYGLRIGTGNTLQLRIGTASATNLVTGGTTLSTLTWYHLAGTYNGSNGYVYKDGAQDGTTAFSGAIDQDTSDVLIGRRGRSDYPDCFDGKIDEVRISSVVRSAAWLKATYHSLWDSLLTYGSEEEMGGVTTTVVACPSPFAASGSIQANLHIDLFPGVLSGQAILSVSEVFWGTSVDCPSPFAAASSLLANTEIVVILTPIQAQGSLQGNTQIDLVVPAFAAQGGLSVGDFFLGKSVDLPAAFSATGSLQANLQIDLVPPALMATAALLGNIGIQVSAGALNAIGSILGIPVDPFSITGSNRIYLFTLTGTADGVDDIVIPISSFQSRIKSGDPTYLSVVIRGTDYADAINARLNGDLIIRMGYSDNSEILLTETVASVDFESIRIDEGATSKSITLDGHRTESYQAKEVNLEDASYRNLKDGKLRYRCTPNLYLRPGDTVNINDDTFVVGSITYSVTPGQELYEVAEA